MQLKDLKPNKSNPRKLSDEQARMLKKSLEKFGDLGCFINNVRFNRLVGAHQRTKVLPANSKIIIEQKYKKPTRCRTVAEGYILVNGERFKYREVDADEQWEKEAMLAANKQGGEWDDDLLKLTFSELKTSDLDIIGFTKADLKSHGIELDVIAPDLSSVKEEETDEEYVANTKESTEQIPTEKINSIEDIKENQSSVVDRRYVLIIDCQSNEHKFALKDKIEKIVLESVAKFF